MRLRPSGTNLAAEAATESASGTLVLHPATAARYLDQVRRLHELLVDGHAKSADGGAEAIAILRGLIRKVIVHPIDDGGFEVEIVGELAALTDSGEFLGRSVGARSAVAGAGLEPATSGL